MLGKTYSAGTIGIDAFIVCCECDVSSGLPTYIFTGYLASEVKEAVDRVRTAIKNSNIELLPKKVVVNLSPASFKKSGCLYDLPIAISILSAYRMVKEKHLEDSIFVGELSLSGEILPVKGIISIAKKAREEGFLNVFVPKENAREAIAIDGIKIYAVSKLEEIYSYLNEERDIEEFSYIEEEEIPTRQLDFKDIKGQALVKRAATIAVAGKHNILLIGPAGTGKSMISKALPSIMPKLSKDESIETTMIYSISGKLINNAGLMKIRPFRSPHHTISKQALIGGGLKASPGEVSLAHNGVLFLDEFAEFKNEVIEVLRQPMEDKVVNISRVNARYTYPADFILCVATNPCKCGFYPDRNKCFCTEIQVRNYLGKISKPMLDRIDICVETSLIKYDDMYSDKKETSSEEIRKVIDKARLIQKNRLESYGILYNAQMNKEQIDKFCILEEKDKKFLKSIYEKKNMSVRALNKILKLSRTIADMEESENIRHEHLCEAIAYRGLEDKYFGGFCGRE